MGAGRHRGADPELEGMGTVAVLRGVLAAVNESRARANLQRGSDDNATVLYGLAARWIGHALDALVGIGGGER